MRRRFVKGRRARPQMRWFPCEETYVGQLTDVLVTQGSLVPVTLTLAQHDRATTAVSTDIQLSEEHTIMAIRGQVLVHAETGSADNSVGAMGVIHMGIKIVELLPNNTAQAYDPSSAEEVDDPWMWLDHHLVAQGIAGLHPGIPVTIPVHIKTKRVLKASHALCLFMRASPVNDGQDNFHDIHLFVKPFLRTLIKRAI